MKRLIFLLLLLASTAHGTITQVQSVSNSTGSSTGTSVAVTVSVLTAGNWLAVGITTTAGRSFNVTLASAQDLIGGGIARASNQASSIYTQLHLYHIITGGATTVNVNTSDTAAIAYAVAVVEYSGANLQPDVWAAATGTSASPSTGTTATAHYANELLVSAIGIKGTFSSAQTARASSPSNSFSVITNTQTSSNINTSGNDRGIVMCEKLSRAQEPQVIPYRMATVARRT